MSKSLTLDYGCGHSRTYTWPSNGSGRPYRNNSHRDQMLAEASVGHCDACARDRANISTAREAVLDGLAPLTGTAAQIAWANTIRADLLPELLAMIEAGGWDDAKYHPAPIQERRRGVLPNDLLIEFRALRARHPAVALAAEMARTLVEIDRAAWWIEFHTSGRRIMQQPVTRQHLLLMLAVDELRDAGGEPAPELEPA
jgi:hypothetical protein